jgi:hypothetical protein
MNPRFTNEHCRACVFLGPVGVFDVWFCPKYNGTVVARFGSEGSAYSSAALGLLTPERLQSILGDENDPGGAFFWAMRHSRVVEHLAKAKV